MAGACRSRRVGDSVTGLRSGCGRVLPGGYRPAVVARRGCSRSTVRVSAYQSAVVSLVARRWSPSWAVVVVALRACRGVGGIPPGRGRSAVVVACSGQRVGRHVLAVWRVAQESPATGHRSGGRPSWGAAVTATGYSHGPPPAAAATPPATPPPRRAVNTAQRPHRRQRGGHPIGCNSTRGSNDRTIPGFGITHPSWGSTRDRTTGCPPCYSPRVSTVLSARPGCRRLHSHWVSAISRSTVGCPP